MLCIKTKRERKKEEFIRNQVILMKRLKENAEILKDGSEAGNEMYIRYDARLECLEEILKAFRYYDKRG